MHWRRSAILATAVLLFLSACTTTPYKDVPVSGLTDEQLVEELTACAAGIGESINRAQYLIATRPDPAYVLSSSTTNYFGTYTANVSAYAMPVGYGYSAFGTTYGSYGGTSNTQYYYTDANAFARSIHDLSSAIAQSQAAAYRQRGLEVLAELQARIERRSAEAEKVVEDFFRENPELKARSKLIGAVLPWVVTQSPALSPREALNQSKRKALSLYRGDGMTGDWFGLLSQNLTSENGETISFNQFLRAKLLQDGSKITGTGEIGTGEQIEISGKITDGQFDGVVANTTSAINSRFSGIVADEQIVVEFVGGGIGQKLQGVAVFFR